MKRGDCRPVSRIFAKNDPEGVLTPRRSQENTPGAGEKVISAILVFEILTFRTGG